MYVCMYVGGCVGSIPAVAVCEGSRTAAAVLPGRCESGGPLLTIGTATAPVGPPGPGLHGSL